MDFKTKVNDGHISDILGFLSWESDGEIREIQSNKLQRFMSLGEV